MYPVTDNELNSLKDSGLSATVDVALFTMCVGIAVTLSVTLSTVEIKDPNTFAAYVASAIVSGVLCLWFGARSLVAYRNARSKLNEIKGSG